MSSLTSLPSEILHNILKFVDPRELVEVSLSCKALWLYISDNRTLHKDIYLLRLDDPQKQANNEELNWQRELRILVKLEAICAGDDIQEKIPQIEFVSKAVTSLLRNAAASQEDSMNVVLLRNLFASEQNQDAFLCGSELFERARSRDTIPVLKSTLSKRQMSAKLHCLYGVPILHIGRTRSTRTYPYAASKVYDLRNYTVRTLWGPFLEDGSAEVDWEKMEAIMVVLGYNLRIFTERSNFGGRIWSEAFAGVVPNSFEPPEQVLCEEHATTQDIIDSVVDTELKRVREAQEALDAKDPYNITGTYMRLVCFLDYTELFSYNFVQHPAGYGNQPRGPLDSIEAIRIIAMDISVTSVDEPAEGSTETMPTVHFEGFSRLMDESFDPNANSRIRGFVTSTPDGEIRWTTISVYDGEERWRSEGVQIGGINSARGVFGNWFDKDYDPHGPAGPTAFWKIRNGVMHRGDDSKDSDGDSVDYFDILTNLS